MLSLTLTLCLLRCEINYCCCPQGDNKEPTLFSTLLNKKTCNLVNMNPTVTSKFKIDVHLFLYVCDPLFTLRYKKC